MSIRLSRMMELVSQAEEEGITLAAMVTREMSAEEMDSTQLDLSLRLSENYAKIERFMSEISVPSIAEIISDRDRVLGGSEQGSIEALSDADIAE